MVPDEQDKAKGRAGALAVARANFATVDEALLTRLSTLGRLTLPIDPLQWAKDMQTNAGGHDATLTNRHLADNGIYGHSAYNTAVSAMKSNEVYKAVVDAKPPKGSNKTPAWRTDEIAAKIKFISSNSFPCQSHEVLTTPQQQDTAEGNRLLTWLYWTNAERISLAKRQAKKTKDKDSKASCTTDLDADCEDEED